MYKELQYNIGMEELLGIIVGTALVVWTLIAVQIMNGSW